MRKSILIIVMFLSFLALAFPVTGDAAYLIRLKNGGEFKTLRYWSEGDQIKFYIYGGVAGVQKDSVRKIEKAASENIIYKKSQSRQKAAEIPPGTNDRKDGKPEEKPDIDYYKEKKALLIVKLDESLERIREATRNKDPKSKEKARDEMKKISAEIYALTDELKEKNKGELPEGWWEKK
ncbi:MAG: hypothetical protein JRD69_06665 [Deltaproteobacteria bacterium]|nr:hypothetical protein [Deltaproteobacteria bacterium]